MISLAVHVTESHAFKSVQIPDLLAAHTACSSPGPWPFMLTGYFQLVKINTPPSALSGASLFLSGVPHHQFYEGLGMKR